MQIQSEWLRKYYKHILIASVLAFVSVVLFYYSMFFGVGFGDENFYMLATEATIRNGWVIPPWLTNVYYGHAGAIGEPLAKPALSLYIPVLFYSVGLFKAYAAFFSILTIALVFYIGWKMYGYWTGLFSAIALAGVPLFINFSVIAYTETMIAFFTLLSVFMIYRTFSSASNKYLLATGIVMGLTFLVKEIAFGIPLMMFAFLLIQKFKGTYEKGSFKKLAVVTLIGLAIVSPWLMRNWYYFQNPMFPQFRSIFGNAYVDPIGVEVLESQARLPLSEMYGLGEINNYFGMFTFIPLALAGMAFLFYKKGEFDWLVILSSAAFTSVIFMFAITDIRYLFSAVPFMALGAGVFMFELSCYRGSGQLFRACAVVLILILSFIFLSVTYSESARIAGGVRVQSSPMTDAFAWIKQNTAEDAVVYDLWVHEFAYFTGRTTTFSNIYSGGHNLYYWWTRSEAEARVNLEGIDYIIVETYLFGTPKGMIWTYLPFESLQFMGLHPDTFKLVYWGEGLVIFEVLKT